MLVPFLLFLSVKNRIDTYNKYKLTAIGGFLMQKRKVLLYIILLLLVLGVMVFSFLSKNYNNVFMCILTLILFLIPTFIERKLNIELPTVLECVIILFIFSAEILGEVSGYYIKIPIWDTLLHTLNGFIMAAIGFSMIDILNSSPKLHFNMSPIFVAFVSFCFSMTIGILWEFFEYGMDIITLSDMQKDLIVQGISSVTLNPTMTNDAIIISDITKTVLEGQVNGVVTQTVVDGGYIDIGLYDTMNDLIVNCIGALSFSVIGIFYIKGRSLLAKNFIPQMKTKNITKNTDSDNSEM